MDASVGAMAADVLTAAAIAADAIGSSEFAQAAADKVWSSAARTLTGLGFSLVAADLAAGIITAAKFAAGAIDAAAIATGAIDADAIAAEALTAAKFPALIEPTGPPTPSASWLSALAWLLALSRNRLTQTATVQTLRNDADSANIATSTLSDDGTTHTRGEFA